jgi:hypothetical protein
MSDEHTRAALLTRVGLERFEIRQLQRELNSVSADASIEADAASAVRAFLQSCGSAPWTFPPPPIDG